jgi:predicted membrane chloride channel (bestrophin family)
MRYYESGDWGFSLVWGIQASVFPRSSAMAIFNATLTFCFASWLSEKERSPDVTNSGYDTLSNSLSLLGLYTSVMTFVLYFRSNVAYSRWWEGGTLLQKTRGEWFNAYSSLMAFTSTDPKFTDQVEEFQHLLARLMSLLFCCGLQQVSPCKDRPFEIFELDGIDAGSLNFLNEAADKVEVILQWIQRATVLHMQSGVLPVAPPVLSRAFQEVSRGIVNLQNARKIADFPFPFPYAQVSMVMLLAHYFFTPVACSYYFSNYHWHRLIATAVAFMVTFFVWCINFIALQLEAPFGSKQNDLPMNQMQTDWNMSLMVLLDKRAQKPPEFEFWAEEHRKLNITMSDGSEMQKPAAKPILQFFNVSEPDPVSHQRSRRSTFVAKTGNNTFSLSDLRAERKRDKSFSEGTSDVYRKSVISRQSVEVDDYDRGDTIRKSKVSRVSFDESGRPSCTTVDSSEIAMGSMTPDTMSKAQSSTAKSSQDATECHLVDIDVNLVQDDSCVPDMDDPEAIHLQELTMAGSAPSRNLGKAMRQPPGFQEKLVENVSGHSDVSDQAWERQLADVGTRMKELHSYLIDEEVRLLASVTRRTPLVTEGTEEDNPALMSCCYPKSKATTIFS